MTLLWTRAVRHHAMPWNQHPDEPPYTPISVRHAGFAGFVGAGDDEHLREMALPEPTRSDMRYLMHNEDWPEGYKRRHQGAVEKLKAGLTHEDIPDIEDPRLHHFLRHHFNEHWLWKPGTVDLTKPLYATQSHVAKEHLDRYRKNPGAPVHNAEYRSVDAEAPMIVTHEGRQHAIEGHHRLAAGIERGETQMPVWHFDLDNHYMPSYDGRDEDDR